MHIPGLGTIKELQGGVFVAVAHGEQLSQAFCEHEPTVSSHVVFYIKKGERMAQQNGARSSRTKMAIQSDDWVSAAEGDL